MYIQEKINQAFKVFCQDPSTKNRDALIAECEELIEVALSLTSWTSEDKETRKDVRNDVMVKLIEFLDRHKDFDQVRNPSAFLYKFVRRNALNCLEPLYSEPKPDQFPVVEKEGWTKPGNEMIELKSDLAIQLQGLGRESEARLVQQLENQGSKESLFYLNLFTESFHDYLDGIRTNKDQFAPIKDWKLDRKMMLDDMARNPRIGSLTRVKPYLRKARFSKKTR